MITPLEGASQTSPAPNPPSGPPFTPVTWNTGYSANDPIDANPAFNINPQTGLLTGHPTQVGQYAFAVKVEEYRNGLKINETIRDFRLDIAVCQVNVVASIPTQTSFCDGRSLSFGNMSQNASNFFWDFGDPNNPNSTSTNPSPSYTYTDTGVYVIMLVAEPGVFCADTAYITYEVYELSLIHI